MFEVTGGGDLSLYVCAQQRSVLLDRIENEQQERQAANEAYDQLRQKHTELSSQAKVQTQLIRELEVHTRTQTYVQQPDRRQVMEDQLLYDYSTV